MLSELNYLRLVVATKCNDRSLEKTSVDALHNISSHAKIFFKNVEFVECKMKSFQKALFSARRELTLNGVHGLVQKCQKRPNMARLKFLHFTG